MLTPNDLNLTQMAAYLEMLPLDLEALARRSDVPSFFRDGQRMFRLDAVLAELAEAERTFGLDVPQTRGGAA